MSFKYLFQFVSHNISRVEIVLEIVHQLMDFSFFFTHLLISFQNCFFNEFAFLIDVYLQILACKSTDIREDRLDKWTTCDYCKQIIITVYDLQNHIIHNLSLGKSYFYCVYRQSFHRTISRKKIEVLLRRVKLFLDTICKSLSGGN